MGRDVPYSYILFSGPGQLDCFMAHGEVPKQTTLNSYLLTFSLEDS